MTVQNYAAAVLIAAAAPVARTADTAMRYGTAVRALTAHQVFRAVLGNKYISIAATDMPKIVPAGYRLAVFRVINAFIAAMDPETVLALIKLAEAGPTPCRCGDMLRDTTIQCPAHPDVRPRTVRERIDFEQAFDAALERSKHKDEE